MSDYKKFLRITTRTHERLKFAAFMSGHEMQELAEFILQKALDRDEISEAIEHAMQVRLSWRGLDLIDEEHQEPEES